MVFENSFESSPTLAPNKRLTRAALRRRKWLFGPFVRITLPVPLMWNRFLAPLWVFIFGISVSFRSQFSVPMSRRQMPELILQLWFRHLPAHHSIQLPVSIFPDAPALSVEAMVQAECSTLALPYQAVSQVLRRTRHPLRLF